MDEQNWKRWQGDTSPHSLSKLEQDDRMAGKSDIFISFQYVTVLLRGSHYYFLL